jgi:F0F1-type ATP synthase alpha subunit
MYSTLADAEFLSGSADGGLILYDVLSQQNGALFDISLQEATLPA